MERDGVECSEKAARGELSGSRAELLGLLGDGRVSGVVAVSVSLSLYPWRLTLARSFIIVMLGSTAAGGVKWREAESSRKEEVRRLEADVDVGVSCKRIYVGGCGVSE